ncbi:MAG TPA: SCO6880 family protein [Streptosporangiaceae bacterium]|jgi:hypothetical protein
MTREPERARTYAGWQKEKVAWAFGLTGRQALMTGCAVLAAIWPLAAARAADALACWPAAALLLALAFGRAGGRALDEWVIAAVSWSLGAAREQDKFAGAAFTPRDRAGSLPSADLPGILAPLRILNAVTAAGQPLAVLHHPYDRTYTSVARLSYPGIGLADSGRRDRRVAGWGSLLAGLCTEGQPITRVQVLQRLVPESGAALRRWHADHLDPRAPAVSAQVTGALLGTAGLATSEREAFLAFTLDARRAARQVRVAGGGPAGAAAVLARCLHALAGPLADADLRAESWLDERELAEALRTAFDPDSAAGLAARRAAARAARAAGRDPAALPGVTPALAGPSAAEARPGRYVHDGGVSAAYWVHSWPRSAVFSTALAPMLGEGAWRRSLSLHIEPLPPRAAERAVMRERTARHVAIRMRQRTGQLVPEDEQAALDRARAQDAERAAGHGLARFTGYAVTTVTSPADLDDACAALEADAAAARIEVRRMWFAQDIGFALGALPLGMGLPGRRRPA